jgi:hypothetical protein
MLIIWLNIFLFFYIRNEGETPEAVNTDQLQAKEGNSSENASETLPPQPPSKKKKTEDQRLERAFELLTACSNQALNDNCQHFGNMIAAKLRNYDDTVRCAIQYDIMKIFLNANRSFMKDINILFYSYSTCTTI